jgi:precorrin-6B methylase 2
MRKTLAALLAAIACATLVLADDASQAAKLYELLQLQPDVTIADIGAGSGEMTVLMAKRLDKSGRVYSTDINQDRLKEIRAAAAKAHLDNVVVLEGAENATNLPDACCDAIFIRNVRIHFVFCAIFAHVSLSDTVRLKTSAPGRESGSTTK